MSAQATRTSVIHRTRGPRCRSVSAGARLLACGLPLIAGGCESAPNRAQPNLRSDGGQPAMQSQVQGAGHAHAGGDGHSDDPLYQQALRDVELFLQHRSSTGTTADASDADLEHSTRGALSSSSARPVQWHGESAQPLPRPDELQNRPGRGLRVEDFPDHIEQNQSPTARRDSALPADAADAEPLDQVAMADDPDVDADDERDMPGGGVNPLKLSSLDQIVVDLSRELYQQAAYADMPLRELLLIAATSIINPTRAIEPSAIPGLTEQERELLRQFQNFFADLGQQLDGSRQAEEVVNESVAKLREALDQRPPLTIATAALCTSVRGFGDYTKFETYSFLAQEDQQAIVYLEIEHFSSTLNQRGDWVTELSQELTIYSDRDGIPVWNEPWQKAVDVSRKQRRDFFTVQIVALPRALSVGRYYFKVRVRDEQSSAHAEYSIPFEMVADRRLTSPRR